MVTDAAWAIPLAADSHLLAARGLDDPLGQLKTARDRGIATVDDMVPARLRAFHKQPIQQPG